MRRALFYSRAAAAVSLLLLAICISTVRPVRPTYSPPRVSRADLATVFRVKNTICLGTGEHATFTSDRHGVFRDPVFSIEYISRSLLPLSALSDGVRFDIDYESCCSSDDVDPCTKRCVIVRHGSDRLEYFDAVGSGSKVPLPLTQVHRRLILLKDHDRIAVWIDGVPLSTRRSQFKQIMVRRDPAPAPAATGAIIVQGTGCLDEITVSAHWRQSNLTSVPLDLRISPESSQQRHWDWYPPSPYLGSDSIKPNVVILAPLSGQVFGRADEIPARWAVTAKLDLLYNNGLLQQCLSIFNRLRTPAIGVKVEPLTTRASGSQDPNQATFVSSAQQAIQAPGKSRRRRTSSSTVPTVSLCRDVMHVRKDGIKTRWANRSAWTAPRASTPL